MATAKRPEIVTNALDAASIVADGALVAVEALQPDGAPTTQPAPPPEAGPTLKQEQATVVVAQQMYVCIPKYRVLKAALLSRCGQLIQYRINDVLSEDDYSPGALEGLAQVGLELERIE
jgi:hypothetical protein